MLRSGVVLALLLVALVSNLIATFVAFDLCCLPDARWRLLPIPTNLFQVVALTYGLFLMWFFTLIVYFSIKATFEISGLLARLTLLAFSIALPTLFHAFMMRQIGGYSSMWGGRVMYSNGRPSETQIEYTIVECVAMWLLVSCILLALHRSQSRG